MKLNIYILLFILFFVSSCGKTEEIEEKTLENKNEQQEKRKDIKFTATSENIIELGEVFQLTFSINEHANNFTPPSFENFDVLAGPFTSSSSSTSIINGKRSRKVSNSYTYNISCSKSGDFTIAPAEVTIEGNIYKSNSLKIKVIGEAKVITKKEEKINGLTSNKDIFLKTTYSKTNVYKGDYIIATTKIYTRKDFQNISETKFPNYDNFWTEVIKAPRQISFKNELLNGKMYKVALLKQTLLFTQNVGNHTISPYEIELQIKKKDGKTRDFFGNIVDNYKLINKKVSTGKQIITVRPLPQPIPVNFSGVTGTNITVETEIDNTNIKTDESANLRILVSGSGNLYLLNDLKLELPKGIEHFKPQVEKSEKYTENSVYAQKQFDYIIVGNTIGSYKFPAIEFIYFNTKEEKYKTVIGSEINLSVTKGEGYVPVVNNKSNEAVRDIRYIKNNTNLEKSGNEFASSLIYYLIIASLFFVYVIFLIIRKKNIEENKDVVKVKKKNASKVSQKRLKTALTFMNENNNQAFYKEVLTSIWGYLSDKMSVNSDKLTNESIKVLLTEKNVEDKTIEKLLNIVELCGYAQYSPSGEESKPENIYKETENVINVLEECL